MCPYERSYIQVFNDIITCAWGYIELMVLLEEGRDTTKIYSKILVVPCKRIYNCILGKSFASTLDTVTFLVRLKLKYHNVHDDLVTINVMFLDEDDL